MSSTPRTTAAALVTALAVTVAALARFLVEGHEHDDARAYLLLFGALFVLRVAGQVAVIAFRPAWLPPAGAWNLLPYRLLLPTQLVLIGLIGAIVAGRIALTGEAAEALVVFAIVYWLVMGVRYAVRMTRRPDQRWFGGAIPIVFHCVLAAFLFVLGTSNADAASAAVPRPPVYGPPRVVLTTDISDHGSPAIEQTGDFNGDGLAEGGEQGGEKARRVRGRSPHESSR